MGSWQARRMTQASFNLRIFLILLWFAATPAFPSSRILFPLHRLRHVEPIEEEPHTRKVQKIADHNIFGKPSSGAVRFPRSVMAGLVNHSTMRILVGDSSGRTPTQISTVLLCLKKEYEMLKHRKNCECCPVSQLIVR